MTGWRRQGVLAVLCLAFILVATANSGGYRFGISDQAFYQPAIEWKLHPELFPRDRALLESQAKLTLVDETLATATRATGAPLPWLFLGLYLISLVVLFYGAVTVAEALAFSPAATTAFLALLTLRHRIARTGANTLEGYMHPRQLAFGLGLLALGLTLKQRRAWAVLVWLVAAALHPTTAAWFALFIVGGMVADRMLPRLTAMHIGAISALVVAGAIIGPHLTPLLPVPSSMLMDQAWTTAFAEKDYIFVSQWPWWAWALNLAYLPLLRLLFQRRMAAGVVSGGERALMSGAALLVLIFAGSVIFSEARLAFAVQLQVSRVFWWLDVLIAAYAAWWLTSDPVVRRVLGSAAPRISIAAVAVLALGRGFYTVGEGGPDRNLFRLELPADDWAAAMQWLKTQPSDWLVLADPDHAWKYGTSVRVAASRDVVLEVVKDSAISLYSRDVALRTVERTRALADFAGMHTDTALRVARQYGVTALVVESVHVLALPKLYGNASFTIYDAR